jgi:hypothetical protein
VPLAAFCPRIVTAPAISVRHARTACANGAQACPIAYTEAAFSSQYRSS